MYLSIRVKDYLRNKNLKDFLKGLYGASAF